jgi:hypothetical protein
MGFFDFVANVATGGAYGVLQAGIDSASGASSPTAAPSAGIIDAVARAVEDAARRQSDDPFARGLEDLLARRQREAPSPPPPPQAICCDRYRFNDGFLVDGVTGLTWQFDESQKAFVEVPRKPAKEKLPLFKALLDAQIETLRNQHEVQLAGPLSPELRAEAAKDFEKRFLKPLRDSAGVG